MKKLCLSLLLSAAALPALAQDVFIDNATVLTPSGVQENLDIILGDGVIQRVGADLTAPDGATIINANGQWVTPPLFAPFSTLGLVEISGIDATNDSRAENGDTSVSEDVADSFNPRSVHVASNLSRGIAHAAVVPNSSGDSIFAGTGMIATLDGDLFGDHKEAAFIRLDLGEIGTQRAGGSRAAAMRQLRAALDDAAAYPSRYDKPNDGDVLSRQDAAALARAVRGQVPIMVSAHRASDLVSLIKLKGDYPSLDLIIVGAAEAWQVAEALKIAKIKVIIDPLDNLPTEYEKTGSRIDNVTLLDDAGVGYAIANLTSLGVAGATALAQHAGNAVGVGLDWDKAFAAISATPASWFDMPNAEIKAGSSATLVVWDGDPLNVTSAPIHMWIGGDEQSLESRQTKLRDRYNPLSDQTLPHKYR